MPPPSQTHPDTPSTNLPNSIALHIGAHKTASSHLQNTLYRNRAMLAEEGIRVYGPGYLRMNGRDLAAMFGLSWSESPPPRRAPHDQLRFLAKGRRRLVFTEENFVGSLSDHKGLTPLPIYPAGPDRVHELVAKWSPVKTQLFVAIRNPATFIASAYSQALFGGTIVGPRAFRDQNDWRRIDWADYIARLRANRVLGEIYVWRQEDYEQAQQLILRRLLRSKTGDKVRLVKDRLNEGLSVQAVRQTLQGVQDGKQGPLARDARNAFPVGDVHKPFALYAASTLARAQAIYDEQFAKIQAMEGVTVLDRPNPDASRQAQG